MCDWLSSSLGLIKKSDMVDLTSTEITCKLKNSIPVIKRNWSKIRQRLQKLQVAVGECVDDQEECCKDDFRAGKPKILAYFRDVRVMQIQKSVRETENPAFIASGSSASPRSISFLTLLLAYGSSSSSSTPKHTTSRYSATASF